MMHSHVCRIIQEGVAVAAEVQSDDMLPLVDFIGVGIDIDFRIAIFADLGLESIGNSPDAFAALIKSEIPKWAKVIKDEGIKAD